MARSALVLLACLAAGAVLPGACAHYPATVALPVNAPAGVSPPGGKKTQHGYAFDNLSASDVDDDIFVCLVFSGGGTRAAALSYGVLEVLRDTHFARPKDGKAESLLDEVDCISSVSGGSFSAAYFGLFGQQIFQDYRRVFLDRNIQGDLGWRVANPYNWFRLWSPYFSRIDLATELYGETIFQGKTFGDLLGARRRPFLILNGTDLSTGDYFTFTQEQFDLIGSDLAAFPVARAVAASSAFPFLLTPISLLNHPAPAWYVPPAQFPNAAEDYFNNRRRFSWFAHQATYLDKAANPYVHLMDGGLADNIGIRAILRAATEPTGFIRKRLNRGKIGKFVIVAVNAKAGPPEDMNKDESPPGLADVAFKTATVAMDNYTFESIETLRDWAQTENQAQEVLRRCAEVAAQPAPSTEPAGSVAPKPPGCPPTFVRPYELHIIDISLDAIADPTRRLQLLNIGTNFSLTKTDVDAVIAAAHELLSKNPDFKALLDSLKPN